MNAVDVFAEILHARLCAGQHDAHTLLELDALRRCDPLFEACADLSDVLYALEQGHGGRTWSGSRRCGSRSSRRWSGSPQPAASPWRRRAATSASGEPALPDVVAPRWLAA